MQRRAVKKSQPGTHTGFSSDRNIHLDGRGDWIQILVHGKGRKRRSAMDSDKAFTGAPHAFEGQGTAQLQFVREDAGDLQQSPGRRVSKPIPHCISWVWYLVILAKNTWLQTSKLIFSRNLMFHGFKKLQNVSNLIFSMSKSKPPVFASSSSSSMIAVPFSVTFGASSATSFGASTAIASAVASAVASVVSTAEASPWKALGSSAWPFSLMPLAGQRMALIC